MTLKVRNEGNPFLPLPPHAGSQETQRFLSGETVPPKKDLEILAFLSLFMHHRFLPITHGEVHRWLSYSEGQFTS